MWTTHLLSRLSADPLSSSVGFAMCKAIAQVGGNIAIIDALPEPVEEFHTLEQKYGIKAFFSKADVTQEDSLGSAVEDAIEQARRDSWLRPCCWNSPRQASRGSYLGRIPPHPDGEHDGDVLDRQARHGPHGQTRQGRVDRDDCIHRCARRQDPRTESGHLQYVEGGGQGFSWSSRYAELSEFDIRVNSISPGVIHSPMTKTLRTEHPKLTQVFENAAPVGRIGVPEDLTTAAVFLLSDAGSFTTGADFIISGGLHAGVRPSWMHRAMPQS